MVEQQARHALMQTMHEVLTAGQARLGDMPRRVQQCAEELSRLAVLCHDAGDRAAGAANGAHP